MSKALLVFCTGLRWGSHMANKVHFSLRYDGPAVADHTMDVREVSDSLMALSELVEVGQALTCPDAPSATLKIEGNFKQGSFGIDLIANMSVPEQLALLLSGQKATAIANLMGILSGLGLIGQAGVTGVIALMKRQRGRKTKAIEDKSDGFEIHFEENQTVETERVDRATGVLFRSRRVRKLVVDVVRPLAKPGVTCFESGAKGQDPVRVTHDEFPDFEKSAAEEEVLSEALTERVWLQIESASFRDGNKWRFSEGAAPFHAEIEDAAFLLRVDEGERFGKMDMLLVDLKRIQSATDTGLKIRHAITRVHEHKQPLQAKLF